MSKSFSDQVVFPVSLSDMRALFTHSDFPVLKYKRLGYENITVIGCHDKPQYFEICCQYQLPPMLKLPASMRRLMKGDESRTITHTYAWDWQTMEGWVEIQMKQPKGLSIRCKTSLIDDSEQGQCIMDLNWHIQCDIPLVGSAIEQQAIKNIREGSHKDLATTLVLLQELRVEA